MKKSSKVSISNQAMKIILILTIIFALSSMSFNSTYDYATSAQTNHNSQHFLPEDDLKENDTNSDLDDWVLVNEFEHTVDIKKSSDLFVKVSPRASMDEKLEIKSQINCQDFFSPTTKNALTQVPNWLRQDLENKFFDLAQTNIDVTSYARAAFGDLDNDKDLDLIGSSFFSGFSYFENCGNEYEPVYLYDDSLLKILNNESRVSPQDHHLGDLDADGDLDLLLTAGWVWLIKNVGDINNPKFNDEYINIVDTTIPPTYYISSCLGDVDADNDLDLLCGTEEGVLYYYENTGTSQSYYFEIRYFSSFSNIEVGGSSVPTFADLDNDGDLDLTIGETNKKMLHYYRNIGTPQSPTWFYDASMYLGLPLGQATAPELIEINDDGRLDLVVGCYDGMLYYFENIGTITDPQWQVWSSYKVFPGIEYYDPISYLKYINHSATDKFAQLILNAKNNQKDEIAFSIAHTSTQVLRTMDISYDIFKKNAELLYEIDKYLDYTDIVEHGKYESGDYYSTVKYNYKDTPSGVTQTTELPRDIYYWYIVHPKITDEEPAYIDPATGEPAAPPVGRFWREYLFYHNDTQYPPDPPTDPDGDGVPNFHYPKDEAPPLLKEKLANIGYVYDSQSYNAPRGYNNDGHNNTRPWGYKDHAIETVSNWVGKTLPLNEQESADGERPIQPVRIAHHHNGNCGELQDLTVAVARTALIPAAGVMLWGEDHVWNEFYERGWHQWDNYWSDGGSVVDNFMNYWVGWGQRGGSGISKWHGDDYVSEVTQQYVPEEDLSTLTIHVQDRDGNSVDGGRVMVGSHWTSVEMSGYQVTIPFPSVWNYTDNNGMCVIRVATQEGMPDGNKNFSFKVISKIGNAERGKTELEHGQDYEFWFTLEGRVPETGINDLTIDHPESKNRFKVELNYELEGAHQYPPNPWVGNYHSQSLTLINYIYGFFCNETNYNYYISGSYRTSRPVEVYYSIGNSQLGNITIELFSNDNLYFVLYNKNSIETYKRIKIKAKLYEKPDANPIVTILEPTDNQTFQIGEVVPIHVYASDDRGIVKISRIINGQEIYTWVDGYKNITMFLDWNTTGETEGVHNITAVAEDANENRGWAIVQVILEVPPPPPPVDTTAPQVKILSPSNGTSFFISDTVRFTGIAEDENGLSSLILTLNSKNYDLLPTLQEDSWGHSWDSTGRSLGEYKFNIRGVDEAGNTARVYGYFKLVEEYIDLEPPVITINKPLPGQMFGLGEQVVFEGRVEDDIGVESLLIKMDSAPWVDITSAKTGIAWIYIWDTIGINVGVQVITIQAADAAENTKEVSLTIILMDVTPPEISITNPAKGAEIDQCSQVDFKGTLDDNIGVDKILLTITGTGGTEKIKKGIELSGTQWCYSWEVSDYFTPGEYTFTATATDYAGNSESASINIKIIGKEKPEKDKGLFGLPGFESGILIITLISMILICRRMSNRDFESK